MKQEERLDRKIRRLYRQTGHPRHFNRLGSKKFQTWKLCLAWIIKQVYKLSYRRVMKFVNEYYELKVHWTTIQKAVKRLPKALWQSLLAATIPSQNVALAAVDGTGFSRTSASPYYIKRIDRKTASFRHVQMISMIDVNNRKFIATHVVAKPGGETKHVLTLYRKSTCKIDILSMDKGFDAEWLHNSLEQRGTFSIAPVRKGCRRGRHRKMLRDCFDWTLYWQRNLVESLFSALKRLFGNALMCLHIKTQTAELFARLIAYNIGHCKKRFSTQPLAEKDLNTRPNTSRNCKWGITSKSKQAKVARFKGGF
jgi:transposase